MYIFVDYWSFQTHFNNLFEDEVRCDWFAIPEVLHDAQMKITGQISPHQGMFVYAADTHPNLARWLRALGNHNGITAKILPMTRRPSRSSLYCSGCDKRFTECPECGGKISTIRVRGIDTLMVVDIVDKCQPGDVAVVISENSDMQIVLRHARDRGVKIIHAGWEGTHPEFANSSFASIKLDDDEIIDRLVRDE